MGAQSTRVPDLTGRVALVTGGSRGIGASIAAALLTHGASVIITGRDTAQLEASRAALAGTSGPAAAAIDAVRADVRDGSDAARAVQYAVDRQGGLDILINNAGVGIFRDVSEMSHEVWADVIGTNLSGVFHCCRAAIPHLRARGGWIINISSLAGKNPFAGGAAYCASKAGLNAFSEALMQEVRHDGIRVSYIMPGSVSTGFGGRGEQGQADWKLAPDDVAQAVIDLVAHPARSLPSRVELRPSRPRQA